MSLKILRENSIFWKGTASAVPQFVESSRATSPQRALAPEGIFINAEENLEEGKNVPQRLKPGRAVSNYGTAEPVPFQETR